MKKSIIAIALFFFAAAAFAASSPIPMLQNTANQMISQLKQNKTQLKRNPQMVNKIVTKVLLPHVDQNAMARSVVPRNTWLSASQAQRQKFIIQFRTLVIRTYAAAFSEYNNETVKVRPIRGGVSGRTNLSVMSYIIRPGKPNIPVSYSLVKQGSNWKIIDFSVEGVSMVRSFSSQFATLAQQGLAKLTAQLKIHNARVRA